MTLISFWRLTRLHAGLLLTLTLCGAIVALGYTLTRPVLYTSEASAYVVVGGGSNADEVTVGTDLAEKRAESYAPLLHTQSLAERVIAQLKLDETPTGLLDRISATVDADSARLDITAKAGSPEEAQQLATGVVAAVAEEVDELETLGQGEEASAAVSVEPFQPATLPGGRSSPSYLLNLSVGGAAGLLLGYLIVLRRRFFDTRIRSVAELESAVDKSVMGIIPLVPALRDSGRGQAPGSVVEAIRQLRTNLRFVDVDAPPRSIVVTSANAGEGKSTVVSTLGRLLAESGQDTVIVDADLRRPSQADIWGVDADIGLTQLLVGDVKVADVLLDTGVAGLKVVPAGRVPPNPAELLGSRRMRDLVGSLAEDALVLLDAPPLLPVTDAGLLAAQSDGALLVFTVGRTYREQCSLCERTLEQVGARTLGLVLNMAPPKTMGSVVYGYGYGTYQDEDYTRRLYARGETGGRRASTRRLLSPLTRFRRKKNATPTTPADTTPTDTTPID